jgi:NAD(P)-dependent dehydrogenase (short-subunit alcohol dehydrogenase family)
MELMMRLKNKVALVTGGGSGIGAATCARFAQEGAYVFVTDINVVAAEQVAAGIVDQGGQAEAMIQDVTEELRWAEVVKKIVAQCGHLDILVNNAGIALLGSAEDGTLADWQLTQKVNLESVFLGTREAIKVMKSTGGSIINISSIAGLIGEPLLAAYNASKGGVRLFTKAAALHCATSGYGIRVNSVHPGYIATPMVSAAVGSLSKADAEAFEAEIMSSTPTGKIGEAMDVANGILFLASDDSSHMTGSELVIDGGHTAR